MKYVALLRGINVGGKAKVEMARLKQTLEQLGLKNITTYINSGNVIYEATTNHISYQQIEKAIEKDFKISVPVLLRNQRQLDGLLTRVPDTWVNDQTMKCDVLFLWDEIDSQDVLKQIVHDSKIEDVKYVPGAVIWRIDRSNAAKGKLVKLVGTDIYKKMTIRNINTVRKLQQLMQT